jgi:hypothetical protein
MCIDMHGQERVSIHIRRKSNEPARNYNPDKATEYVFLVIWENTKQNAYKTQTEPWEKWYVSVPQLGT